MRSRLAIIVTIALMLITLIALNAASYVRVEREVLTEFDPDRSTFNSDASGTRAFYEFLQESGYEVSRWGKPLSALGSGTGPANFVIVGKTSVDIEEGDAEPLLEWVSNGGRLVIIDRVPPPSLSRAGNGWQIGSEIDEYPGPQVRSDDIETMTRNIAPIRPSQPTGLTRDVDQVVRSRFAGRLKVERSFASKSTAVSVPSPIVVAPIIPRSDNNSPPPPPKPASTAQTPVSSPTSEAEASPTPEASEGGAESADAYVSSAPVEHLAASPSVTGALLVDYVYGRGRIAILSDPFIVSNGGVKLADNVHLATNVVTGDGGSIAFDEYHHGHGATANPVLAYFAGTPVLWIFGQAGVLLLAAIWTRGRRFARALPLRSVDRGSKLEFVASMAEIQERARAYDLAIENIYARTRRALTRYAGLQPNARHNEIAERVALRSGRDASKIEELLRTCEDAIRGEPLSGRKAVSLVRQLRELEQDLGILMRAREIRQGAVK